MRNTGSGLGETGQPDGRTLSASSVYGVGFFGKSLGTLGTSPSVLHGRLSKEGQP